MKAGTGIGIAALVIAVIGALIPVIGLFVGWAALLVALLAALFGDKGLTIATVIISVAVFVFLTPSLWIAGIASVAGENGGATLLKTISIVLLLAPIGGIILFQTGKFALGRRPGGGQP